MKKAVGQMSAKGELRVLVVEDRNDDAMLLLHELERGGYVVTHTRVETVDALKNALAGGEWQLVVSDFSLPSMTAHDVLKTVNAMRPELPCIVVSGTISEEAAVDVLRAGARDFVVKERMARLIPAIGRELQESVERRRRHEAEATLQETRERMQFALEAVGIGTWEVDFRTGRANWSDVLEQLHGLAPGTFGGTVEAVAATIHPEDREQVMQRIGQAKADQQNYRAEYRTTWPDGSTHWIASIGRTVGEREAGTLRAVGVGMDITAQKRLEEQFRQAQKMESIGSLAGGIAHDFNNLLTVIGGCCELVALRVPPDTAVTEPLEEIRSATQSATALTRQLLTFSRQQIVMPQLLDLTATIKGFGKILRRLVEENVQIEFRLSPDPGLVRADPGQVEQVLLNLVANARDAMPVGGTVTIETRRTTLEPDQALLPPKLTSGDYVELSVADNGSGMSAEVRARLFEPFFTTKPVGRGTGLGLATVYGIVRQTGGHIVVHSVLGVGTTFRIYLPIAAPAADVAPPSAAAAPNVATGHETILVVEDNAALRRLNERVLQRYGYKVLAASNGVEAQQICSEYPGVIHVVLADVIMPGESGPKVAEWIVERRPDTRIIYTSGYVGEAIAGTKVIEGTNTFLQKPFTPTQLVDAIQQVLSRPTARADRESGS
jgi:two-component system, cell cycle sensor histidine kinase and response regulator CckA